MTKNFEAFLKLDKSKFQNKYVIIVKRKVVAKGEDIEKILAQVGRRFPGETPFVAKILDQRMLVLS
jgi:preprotein translocase subunit SecD